jgi:hypothetical protein
MKMLLASTILFFSIYEAFTQGTVNFNTRSGGTSHVWFSYSVEGYISGNSSIDNPPGSTSYAGFTLIGAPGSLPAATTFAQLLGAPGANAPESSLLPSTSPAATFRTGIGAGNVTAGLATFGNILPDAPVASFEMAVWDNSSGLYPTWTEASVASQAGIILAFKSQEFVIQSIGGQINFAPDIEPALQSFGFGIPEPSTIALVILAAGLCKLRARRRGFTVN